MNIFNDFRDEIRVIIEQMSDASALPTGLDTSAVTVEPPRDPAHGDLASNVALVLAKQAGAKPRQIADAVAQRLADNLEALIEAEGAETIAGFIAEPVMGAGGALVPPEGYFEKIEAVLRKHDIAFIP